MNLPSLIVHADWSIHPKKQWLCKAHRRFGHYEIQEATKVDGGETLLERLRDSLLPDDTLLIGFDFAIGLPQAYCAPLAIVNFKDQVQDFGVDIWNEFYNVATNPPEISPHRPFYPFNAGAAGQTQGQLVAGLGVPTMDALLRQCELGANGQRPGNANALFWLVGPKQVGRAAIDGWQNVIAPAIQHYPEEELGIWPFDGRLDDLLRRKRTVLAETYPAECYYHVNFSMVPPWSKRTQEDRRDRGKELVRWSAQRPVVISPALLAQLDDGFGEGGDGEDPFDAAVGACSMIDVVLNYRTEGNIDGEHVRTVEGWILGQG
jgi:hypothetical protein